MNKPTGHIDWFILLPTVGLALFSMAFVYSASASIAALKFGSPEGLFLKHTIRILIGLVVLFTFSKIDYHFLRKLTKPMLILALILLVIVLFTDPINNVTRWINIGPISFQPSEFAKFALVLHFASLLVKKQGHIKDLKEGFLPLILWTAAVCFLIGLQPNFSTAGVVLFISLSIMFIGNCNLFHIGAAALASLTVGVVYLITTAGYRLDRMTAFFSDFSLAAGSANMNYQLNQALIALGSGGIFGLGPGQSRQSNLFLPESYGDFIFSIIGEEYGFIGATLIIAAFVLIIWRGMLIAKKAPDKFGYFLAAGIITTLAAYVFVNAGVNSGLLPTTGLPMPFVSYGGTAVIFNSAAVGILLNISAQAGVYPRRQG